MKLSKIGTRTIEFLLKIYPLVIKIVILVIIGANKVEINNILFNGISSLDLEGKSLP
jgi:hypothetical protein